MRDEQFIESRAILHRWVAFIVFFVSGFAALLYQVIWQRLLVFFSGADVYAVTLIVTTFMAGLGLGNLVGGYVADRFSRRTNLVMFIAAELAIMIFGLLSKGFFYDFLYTRHPELGQSSWLLWIVLFCSLLWPTFFMGVSLPLLAKALTRDVGDAAPTIGRLYGINTLGAAIGALVTTWIFLPQLGLEQSLKVGAALNFACAGVLILFIISVRKQPEAGSVTTELRQQEPNPSLPRTAESTGFTFGTWLLLYVLSGFIALSLEILWLRLLTVMLKCTAFAFGTMLTIYLGGLGLGAIAGTNFVQKSRRPASVFLALQTLVAVTGVGIFGAANVSGRIRRDCDNSFGLAHCRISHSKFINLLWSSRSAQREPRSQWHFDMVAKSSGATGDIGGNRTLGVVPGSCAFGFNPAGHNLDGFKFSLSTEGSSARHSHNRQASRRAAGGQHSRLYGGGLPDWFDFVKPIRNGRNSEDRDRPGVNLRGFVAAQHF